MKIYKLAGLLLCIGLFQTLTAQTDQEEARINNFTAAAMFQTKGISTIPNLTLGKPAFTFDLMVGRKLSFEPQFGFQPQVNHGPLYSGGDIKLCQQINSD